MDFALARDERRVGFVWCGDGCGVRVDVDCGPGRYRGVFIGAGSGSETLKLERVEGWLR